MANKFFGAISHIGGADGDLDKISKDIISDGDGAFVVDATNNTVDVYTLNASGDTTVSETTPILYEYIIPDDEAANPGKRWERVKIGTNSIDALGAFAAALLSGADATLITGTKGTNGNVAAWNGDGDLIDTTVTAASIPEIDEANEWTAQQNFDETAITSSGNSVAWDWDAEQVAVHTLTENTTIAAPSNANAGSVGYLRVVQAAGVFTLAWNATFNWGQQATPAEPAANGDEVLFGFYYDGSEFKAVELCRVEA